MYTNTEDLAAAFRQDKPDTGHTHNNVDTIVRALDGASQETGSLEAAACTARNNSRALALLLFALVDNGTLKARDAAEIIYGGMFP